MRTDVLHSASGQNSVYICTKYVKKYMDLDEKEFKKILSDVKGEPEMTLPFLNDVSNDCIVRTANSKQRRCVQIPHTAIRDDVLAKLKHIGKTMLYNLMHS